jgi:hypothetical protein
VSDLEVSGDFTCARCGHDAWYAVSLRDAGPWAEAWRRTTVVLLRCPRCRRRARGALGRFGVSYAPPARFIGALSAVVAAVVAALGCVGLRTGVLAGAAAFVGGATLEYLLAYCEAKRLAVAFRAVGRPYR